MQPGLLKLVSLVVARDLRLALRHWDQVPVLDRKSVV